ncbi:hypothetical protein, partial [Parasaccharibacter apium]|uniref:hypothetical protein n=1 Tax=Parasaccharibacter apium TaxID=1510841 RepID=UPI001AAE8B08
MAKLLQFVLDKRTVSQRSVQLLPRSFIRPTISKPLFLMIILSDSLPQKSLHFSQMALNGPYMRMMTSATAASKVTW